MTLNDCYFYYAYAPGLNGFKLLSKEGTHFFFFLLFDHFINFFYSITNRNNAVDKLLYVTSMYLFKRQLVEGCPLYFSSLHQPGADPGSISGGRGEMSLFTKSKLIFLLGPYIVIFCKFQGVIGWMGPEPPPPLSPRRPHSRSAHVSTV